MDVVEISQRVMHFLSEFFVVLLKVLWYYLESTFRLIIPVARKRIDGEIALVTGGGGKIGECIAAELAKQNAKIVLWDVNAKACERVASKLRKDGVTVYAYQCDLTDKDQVYSLAKKVEEEIGHVTILVNNAGIFFSRRFLSCSDDELAKQVEVNTIAHFWTTKAFLPHMHEINHGHIVTVSSTAGIFGTRNSVGYCTSKFGSYGFNEALTMELMMNGKTGVKTTCLCPLMVDTPLLGKTSSRFPWLFPRMSAEYVAKELVDGVLRDKDMVIVPKGFKPLVVLRQLVPTKAFKTVFKYYNFTLEEETANTMLQRRQQATLAEERKCFLGKVSDGVTVKD